MAEKSELIVSGTFSFYNGCQVEILSDAKLVLGSGYMNGHGKIVCADNIEIGKGVCIADDVIIQDSDFHCIERTGFKMSAPVKIEDHSWLGIRTTVIKGVMIGEGSVIAAGSLVNKSVSPKSLMAGVPAKTIRENISWR